MTMFHITTLGCKTNQYESQGIREALAAEGFCESDDRDAASICVINTCSVTQRADAECRKLVRSIHRKNPVARIVVTGCMVDLGRDNLADLPGVLFVVPNAEKHAIGERLRGAMPEDGFPGTVAPDRFSFSIAGFAGHTRAFVKIQDGCDNFCTYCTIPLARGMPESRPLPAILEECRRLIDAEYRELVLTGINIGQYRIGDCLALDQVVSAIARLPGILRLRLGSVEPIYITEAFLDAIAESPVVCSHLHIPLQSGDDNVLEAMNRRYTRDDFERVVDLARSRLDNPAITTDVIVGFPTEDEHAFSNTLAFISRIGFSRTHVFLYSPREGTPAAKMHAVCPNRECTARRDLLLDAADAAANAYAQTFVGETVSMLVEETAGTRIEGYTERYLRVSAEGKAPRGEIVPVRVVSAMANELTGTALQSRQT